MFTKAQINAFIYLSHAIILAVICAFLIDISSSTNLLSTDGTTIRNTPTIIELLMF